MVGLPPEWLLLWPVSIQEYLSVTDEQSRPKTGVIKVNAYPRLLSLNAGV